MEPPRQQQGLDSFFNTCSANKHSSTTLESYSLHRFKRQKGDKNESRFGKCPLCQATLPRHVLEAHASNCTGHSEKETVETSHVVTIETTATLKANHSHENSRFEACPLCNTRFPMHLLMAHASGCTGKSINTSEKKEPKVSNKKHLKPSSVEKEDSSTYSSENKLEVPWWQRSKPSNTPQIDNPILPSSEPIPGLYLFENFISQQEESIILAELDGTCPEYRHEFLPWKQTKFNGSNKGKRWGVHCNLLDRRVDAPQHPMPHFFQDILAPKLKRVQVMLGCIPNEANAIDYRRQQGHWLQSHVDDRQLSKEPIANLSIAGDCVMTFRNECHPGRNEERVLLQRRTLQILTGKARYDYSHGISNQDLLSDRRVSITMRESPLTKPVKKQV